MKSLRSDSLYFVLIGTVAVVLGRPHASSWAVRVKSPQSNMMDVASGHEGASSDLNRCQTVRRSTSSAKRRFLPGR
jgi:hypothetical protein